MPQDSGLRTAGARSHIRMVHLDHRKIAVALQVCHKLIQPFLYRAVAQAELVRQQHIKNHVGMGRPCPHAEIVDRDHRVDG